MRWKTGWLDVYSISAEPELFRAYGGESKSLGAEGSGGNRAMSPDKIFRFEVPQVPGVAGVKEGCMDRKSHKLLQLESVLWLLWIALCRDFTVIESSHC